MDFFFQTKMQTSSHGLLTKLYFFRISEYCVVLVVCVFFYLEYIISLG